MSEGDAAPAGVEAQREAARAWFGTLRDRICAAFEQIEQDSGGSEPAGRFERRTWQRPGGGGGEMALMRGRVFEKVGVNVSTVFGTFTPRMAAQIPGAETDPRFWASGVSLVAHMCSPHVPATHMNTRFITTTRQWFGGGADMTPYSAPGQASEDGAQFHQALQQACDAANPAYYRQFSEACDQYFRLPHRGETRGLGGIFYDQLNSGDFAADFAFTRSVGQAFLDVVPRIVRQRMGQAWTDEERRAQLVRRGRYVEFNLLYDRGTRFGLETDGNTEAILMSLPPEVHWP